MGDTRPKSPVALRRYGGPGGYDRLMSDLTTFDPVGLSRAEAGSLTYAEAWRQYVRPAIERQKQDASTTSGAVETDEAGYVKAPTGKVRGGFDVTRASKQEACDFFDKMCGSRKYEGPRWWIPGEVPGITFYQGPGN